MAEVLKAVMTLITGKNWPGLVILLLFIVNGVQFRKSIIQDEEIAALRVSAEKASANCMERLDREVLKVDKAVEDKFKTQEHIIKVLEQKLSQMEKDQSLIKKKR